MSVTTSSARSAANATPPNNQGDVWDPCSVASSAARTSALMTMCVGSSGVGAQVNGRGNCNGPVLPSDAIRS